MALMDDIKNLDPKDTGSWPISVQLVVLVVLFFLLLVGGYFGVWRDQLQTLDDGKAAENQLMGTFKEKKAKAVNLDAYKQQLVEIKQTFEVLLKQLPKKSEIDALLTEVNQAGVARGLQFDLWKPAGEVKTAEMAEQSHDIEVVGRYHDVAGFVSDVAKLSRIVTLSNVQLKTYSQDQSKDKTVMASGAVKMAVKAKTYRYLDEEEKMAAKREEDAKKNKGRKNG